jgi:glucose-1-phosphate adenylyltransferase
MDPNLVILAGGISSRMKKSIGSAIEPRLLADAETKAKAMIGVGEGNRPLLDYLLFNAREAGYRDVVIVVGERDSSIRGHYGGKDRGNEFERLSISYAVQPIPEGRTKPLGTADALLRALEVRPDWMGKHLTVCNSDNLYSQRALAMMLEAPSGCALIDYDRDALGFPRTRIEQFAVVIKKPDGAVADIVEKPTPDNIAAARNSSGRIGVSMNIWRFPYDCILPCVRDVPLHPVRLEKELPAAVLILLHRWPGLLVALPLAEPVPDLTDRTDITSVREYLARTFPNFAFGSGQREP